MKKLSNSTVELVTWAGDDKSIARNAKVSFGKDTDPRLEDDAHVAGLINFLIREKHMSPFDHGVATFLVETPIFVAREFMRHRTGQYNEISGRYTKSDLQMYVPNISRPLVQVGKAGDYKFGPGTADQHELADSLVESAYLSAIESYERMLEAGIAKEVARVVLPVGMYTRFYATFNIRNLMHFLNLRTADNALYEIREVAKSMEAEFEKNMPLTYKAWKEHHGA